jgi:hypothetical protein
LSYGDDEFDKFRNGYFIYAAFSFRVEKHFAEGATPDYAGLQQKIHHEIEWFWANTFESVWEYLDSVIE